MSEFWIDLTNGMLFEQRGKRILGRTVQFEQLELNYVKIEGKYYRLGKQVGRLMQVHHLPKEEFDDFDLQPQVEEAYANA